MQDQTGILFLDYKQPLAIWNCLFGLLRAGRYQGKEVRVRGWFRRAPVPFLEVYRLEVVDDSLPCEGAATRCTRAVRGGAADGGRRRGSGGLGTAADEVGGALRGGNGRGWRAKSPTPPAALGPVRCREREPNEKNILLLPGQEPRPHAPRIRSERKAAIEMTLKSLAAIAPETPQATRLITLLRSWLGDESGYDERTWPKLKRLSTTSATVLKCGDCLMADFVLLDSGPLGMISHPRASGAMSLWAATLAAAGVEVLIRKLLTTKCAGNCACGRRKGVQRSWTNSRQHSALSPSLPRPCASGSILGGCASTRPSNGS